MADTALGVQERDEGKPPSAVTRQAGFICTQLAYVHHEQPKVCA